MAAVRFEHVSRVYADGVRAVDDLDLEIEEGELLVLVGPSGCGKSTTLRLLAGLDEVSTGHIWIGERDVTRVRPQVRDVAMVFQSYALYPHKSVRQNLAFPLRMKGTPARRRREVVEEVAAILGLTELLDRRPGQLSGGQRQRVALGRAIVREPAVFLLDEPLSNLDVALRSRMRAELRRLHRRLSATMLHVTHDQEEAMILGDRIGVMRAGRLEQVGPPLEVYRRPATTFVAQFVGSPTMNLLPGRVEGDRVRAEGIVVDAPDFLLPASGTAVQLGIRPQDVQLVEPSGADLRARVDLVECLGDQVVVHATAGVRWVVVAAEQTSLREGETVALWLRRDRLQLFDAEGRRLPLHADRR